MNTTDKLKAELEILMAIENSIPPTHLPLTVVTTNKDPYLKIPEKLQEYLNGINYKVQLEEDGRIHVDKYEAILKEVGMPDASLFIIELKTI